MNEGRKIYNDLNGDLTYKFENFVLDCNNIKNYNFTLNCKNTSMVINFSGILYLFEEECVKHILKCAYNKITNGIITIIH